MGGNYTAVGGIAILLGIAVLFSTDRRTIDLRIAGSAFAVQLMCAVFALKLDWGIAALQSISHCIHTVINYSGAGIGMVFGGLVSDKLEFSIAVSVLPIIIFFSALMSVLYYLNIMPWVVRVVGGGLSRLVGTGRIESLNAAANIFVGLTEAPLVIKPHLSRLTEQQLFAVMVSGMASVSGTVLAGYAMMGADINVLLAASVMSAPGSLLMAKVLMPDGKSENAPIAAGSAGTKNPRPPNVILAAADGAANGLKLAVSIGAMLIAFVGLIALVNGMVGGVGHVAGIENLSLQKVVGWAFSPLMYLLSVPWDEASAAGALFGEKLILNEFVAFTNLRTYLVDASDRTAVIVTFSLCGFANFSAIAVLLGGLGTLIPEKKALIAKFGVRAVLAASLANLMSAALAGLMLPY